MADELPGRGVQVGHAPASGAGSGAGSEPASAKPAPSPGRARTRPRRFVAVYVRLLSAALLVQGVVGGAVKVAGGDVDDLAHSLLHAVSGVAGLAARRRPHRFAVGFGCFYLVLAVRGALWPGALPGLPLAAADHVFHVLVGAATLVAGVGLADRRTAGGPVGAVVWLLWALSQVVGVGLAALPDDGPRLVSISSLHGPSAVDVVGVVILTTGWVLLDLAIARNWRLLAARAGRRGIVAGAGVMALALAVVATSVLADRGWWWVGGAGVLAAAQLSAALLVSGGSAPRGDPPKAGADRRAAEAPGRHSGASRCGSSAPTGGSVGP